MEKLTLLENPTSFKLVIPAHVEDKIRYLCTTFNNREWSGILFYTSTGTFKDKDFVATCEDIYLMDIGESAFTSFKESPDVANYMCNHPDLLKEGIHYGLIHSHHHMATFFSQTDAQTLYTEGMETVHFLSLIVNNEGTYNARITRRIDKFIQAVYTVTTSYKTFNGDTISSTGKEESKDFNRSAVEWFNLKIDKPETVQQFTEIDDRIKELKSSKVPYIDPLFSRNFTTYNKVSNTHTPIIPANPSKKTVSATEQEILELVYKLVKGTVLINFPECNTNFLKNYINNEIEEEYQNNGIMGKEDNYKDWINNFVEYLFIYEIPDNPDYGYSIEYYADEVLKFFENNYEGNSPIIDTIIEAVTEIVY